MCNISPFFYERTDYLFVIISRYVRLEVSRTEEGEETQEFPAQLPFFLSCFQSKLFK